ncbi:hypothetical protein EPN96_04455 [bacterium]|nr:MAG: hypothetical protein EPN96_04455 [bacterium]
MRAFVKILPGFLALALLLGGCAGARLAFHPQGTPVDAEIPGGELSRYNAELPQVRVNGEAFVPEIGEVDYGARVESGVGARFDGFAGPMAKQVFAAACSDAGECEIYLPDEEILYRDGTREFSGWFSALLGGRVPIEGRVVSAWKTGGGAEVLRLEDNSGRWQTVLIGVRGLPIEALYGEAGEKPNLKIAYSEYLKVGDSDYPGVISLSGENGEERLRLKAKVVLSGPGKRPLSVKIKTPEDTKIDSGGEKLWEKLGIFR